MCLRDRNNCKYMKMILKEHKLIKIPELITTEDTYVIKLNN